MCSLKQRFIPASRQNIGLPLGQNQLSTITFSPPVKKRKSRQWNTQMHPPPIDPTFRSQLLLPNKGYGLSRRLRFQSTFRFSFDTRGYRKSPQATHILPLNFTDSPQIGHWTSFEMKTPALGRGGTCQELHREASVFLRIGSLEHPH